MRIKLDENLGGSVASLLRAAGHDVATVIDQRMVGASDSRLLDVCRQESRVVVSLDLDLANPLVFPPNKYHGIVVLRPGTRYTIESILSTAGTFVDACANGNDPVGDLWVVQAGRIRIFDPEPQS